jgi:hypothetical protein
MDAGASSSIPPRGKRLSVSRIYGLPAGPHSRPKFVRLLSADLPRTQRSSERGPTASGRGQRRGRGARSTAARGWLLCHRVRAARAHVVSLQAAHVVSSRCGAGVRSLLRVLTLQLVEDGAKLVGVSWRAKLVEVRWRAKLGLRGRARLDARLVCARWPSRRAVARWVRRRESWWLRRGCWCFGWCACSGCGGALPSLVAYLRERPRLLLQPLRSRGARGRGRCGRCQTRRWSGWRRRW